MESLDIASIVTKPGTYVLVFMVFFVTELIKRGVYIAQPKWRKQGNENDEGLTYLTPMAQLWNKVILYTIPVVLGIFCTFADHEFFWGDLAGEGHGQVRAMLGMLYGFLSGYLVKCGKNLIASKTGVKFEAS